MKDFQKLGGWISLLLSALLIVDVAVFGSILRVAGLSAEDATSGSAKGLAANMLTIVWAAWLGVLLLRSRSMVATHAQSAVPASA
jgi:hypothetical protein